MPVFNAGPGFSEINGTNEGDEINSWALDSGASILARGLDGNDTINIFGGFNNFANGNNGTDNITVFYGDSVTGVYKGAGGRFLGGEDTDIMSVENGNIFRINGNNGDDLIIGNSGRYFFDNGTYQRSFGEFRGGAGNDVLAVDNGYVYGDRGSDTFIVRPPTALLNEYAYVVDYTPSVDKLMYSTEYGFLQFVPESVEGITGLSVFQQGVRSMFLAGISSYLEVTPIGDNQTVSLFA